MMNHDIFVSLSMSQGRRGNGRWEREKEKKRQKEDGGKMVFETDWLFEVVNGFVKSVQ